MKPSTPGKRRNLLWILPLLLALVLVCYALAVRIVHAIDYRNNDFFTFWLAGRMLTQGGNPYSSAQWVAGHATFGVTWIPNQVYVYPLPLSLLFAPLGLLPLQQAYTVWVALSELMILAALALLVRAGARGRPQVILLPLLAGTIFFRPAILTLFNGQISGWLLLLLAGTVYLWEQGRWEWGSLLLPLLMLKPNLGAPLVFLLGIWLLFQKRYRSLLVMLLGGLALLVVGLLQDPRWVMEYWSIGSAKMNGAFGFSPTVWGLGYLVCRQALPCTQAFGATCTLLLAAVALWLSLRRRADLQPAMLVSLAVTVALLVTPYTWTYDQVLLVLPIAVLTTAMQWKGLRVLVAASFFLLIDVLILFLLFYNILLQIEILNAAIPLLVLGVCVWQLLRMAPKTIGRT